MNSHARENSRLGVLILSSVLGIGVSTAAGCGGSAASPPAISVSLTPSAAQSLDQGQTVAITAALTNDSSNEGVTWSLSEE